MDFSIYVVIIKTFKPLAMLSTVDSILFMLDSHRLHYYHVGQWNMPKLLTMLSSIDIMFFIYVIYYSHRLHSVDQ